MATRKRRHEASARVLVALGQGKKDSSKAEVLTLISPSTYANL
jgi:hypothetical protein